MDTGRVPNLHSYIIQELSAANPDSESLAHAQNFAWDERPPLAGIDLYATYFQGGPVAELDDWVNRHRNYTTDCIRVDREESDTPWTFRPGNDRNRLRNIEKNLYLIRVEDAAYPCGLAGVTTEDLRAQVEAFQSGDASAQAWLERVVETWNARRDKRPQFVTTELEVEDILLDSDPAWADRLRDRLGLGHYSPAANGPPIEVVVMRYTVAEVLANAPGGNGAPAVPTVLDSDMSPFFFPSPKPGPNADENPYFGHTLNLTPVLDRNTYEMGVELLHPSLEYRPEHFFRVGVVATPVATSIERARSFHLPWLQLFKDRDDFGSSPGVGS